MDFTFQNCAIYMCGCKRDAVKDPNELRHYYDDITYAQSKNTSKGKYPMIPDSVCSVILLKTVYSLSSDNNAIFFETSSKTGENIGSIHGLVDNSFVEYL